MVRPAYETDADVANEAAVIGRLRAACGFKAAKLPRWYEVDYAACRGEDICGWLEVKVRGKSYSTYRVSLKKWRAGLNLSATTRLPFLLVVCWPERGESVIRYVAATRTTPFRVVFAGRWDRGGAQDMGPMAEIDMAHFKLLQEGSRA